MTPKPVARGNDADNLWGPAWHARRTADGFVLQYDTGDLAGRERRFDISAEEFARLRADPEQFDPIVRAHGG
ncbi:hypothetical protein CKY28_12930 [Sphingomonas lenta]|uniref:Uncharacterized protein n=1 Tax=Sphingomonas lenta TaxID=1141887 RepID=A0A2A2SCH4_9SPHN|nr:hypothetical protein CKY28_12930 [Sphingomonas lenta]